MQEHGITADITYLPELQRCAPGRYTKVDRKFVGMSTEIGALDISVTLPPGTVREGETFVLTWSVLPMSANDMKALEFGGFKVKDGFRTTVEFDIAAGTVQPCEPISAASP